jgi:excisionase family DNA binding protein
MCRGLYFAGHPLRRATICLGAAVRMACQIAFVPVMDRSSAGIGTTTRRDPETRKLPVLLTSGEVAQLLRTTRKAVYAMVERGQLPGVVRLGRRVLFRESALVDWLRQKSTPSLER